MCRNGLETRKENEKQQPVVQRMKKICGKKRELNIVLLSNV
jgi:hypothetical protein